MIRYLLLLLFIFSANHVFAVADLPISNAGFAPSNIWYSKDPFYANESVRIYTVIFNGSAYDLAGSVEFVDNGVAIDKAKFSIARGGRAQDLWVDWKAKEGKHTITARLVGVVADGPNGKQSVVLPNAETGVNERVVEVDPAIVEAQKKIQDQKVAEVGAQVVGVIEDVVHAVEEATPTPIKEAIFTGTSVIEKFRIDEASQLAIIKKQKAKEIEVMSAKSKSNKVSTSDTKKDATSGAKDMNATEKPFAYAMLATVGALQFIFEWKVLFYGIILYCLYRIIKWVVLRIRNRE